MDEKIELGKMESGEKEAVEKPARKKRASVRSSRSKKAGASTSVDAKQLQGIHAILSHLFKIEELQITDDEAKAQAEAYNALSEQYQIKISGKTAAWMNLLAVNAMIYLPRAGQITAKLKEKRAKKKTILEAVESMPDARPFDPFDQKRTNA